MALAHLYYLWKVVCYFCLPLHFSSSVILQPELLWCDGSIGRVACKQVRDKEAQRGVSEKQKVISQLSRDWGLFEQWEEVQCEKGMKQACC